VTRDKTVELWDIDSATRAAATDPGRDGQKLVGFDADGYLDVLTGESRIGCPFVDPRPGGGSRSMDVGLG